MHKFYFTNRVVDQWNSLPTWVVTLRYLKNELIDIRNIRILYLIFEHKSKEPEVAARFRE